MENIELKIGLKGKNTKGIFNIIGLEKNSTAIEYTTGEKAHISNLYIHNFLTGEVSFTVESLLRIEQDINFFKTAGYIASCGFIGVDVDEKNFEKFNEDYKIIIGKQPIEGTGYWKIRNDRKGNSGTTFEITYPYSIGIGFTGIKTHRINNKERINNQALGWKLVKLGFELGKQQNISKILLNVPSQYIEDFKSGYTLGK